ncbi:MAG: LPS export ABC transporter permease LptG [Gammaproteobacteria bacterium]|nr:MAG: LPS export ABC transporter permease LptG [Gammaproteobacteria bacterium]
MKIIDKHIGRQVVKGAVMTLVVLVAIDLVFAYAREVNDIGRGDYDFAKSLIYTFLTAPRRAYDFMPMAAIVGSMVMLGSLARNSEFIAMRSAGISVARISGSVIKSGLILVIIALVLGEVVTPFSEPYAQQMRSFATTKSTALRSEHGIWVRDGSNFINIQQARLDGELRELDIYEFDDSLKLRNIAHATSAQYEDSSWTLYDLEQIRLSKEELKLEKVAKARWDALFNPDVISVLAVKPEQLPIWRLTTYMDYLRVNGLTTEPYEFAFWRKITTPLAILIMLLLSVPFLFTSIRTSGAGQRIMIGIVLGIGYYLVTHLTGRLGEVYDFDPMLSSVIPSLIFLLLGIIGIRFTT